MPRRSALLSLTLAAAFAAAACPVFAADPAAPAAGIPDDVFAQKLYDQVSPSLVAVKFTYVGETLTHEFIVPGIVVSHDGLVMVSLAAISDVFPDEQIKKFKIIIPELKTDNEEIDAEFQGRDERSDMAFVKARLPGDSTLPTTGPSKAAAARVWTPIHFEQLPTTIGETVYSVGMLGKTGDYHTFLTRSLVASHLRGPIKQVMVSGGSLSSPGAPVFNSEGKAIGVVGLQAPAELSLDDEVHDQRMSTYHMLSEMATNRFFIPTNEFAMGLADPPTPGHPIALPWLGLPELTGLSKNDASLFGLANQPAIQINDLFPGAPAEKAGLKRGDVIVKFNGKPLERGDQPDELPVILERKLAQFKPGDVVTFTVTTGKDKPTHEVKVTLAPYPKRANEAARYWNEDIGFGVREMVPLDRYVLKLKKKDKDGVLVTILKEGGAAASAELRPGDMIIEVNGQPVTDLDSFKSVYEGFRKDHPHEAIVMLVHRGNSDQTIRIEPPQQ
jgi:serine protease Do